MVIPSKRLPDDDEDAYPSKRPSSVQATTSQPDGLSETPLETLLSMLNNHKQNHKVVNNQQGRVVVWWMRMRDLRLTDNRALAVASQLAQSQGKYLVALHLLSPGDFRAHDRSARRIDFVLRNLVDLRERLHLLHIPLYVTTVEPRKQVPRRIIELLKDWGAYNILANIEHEVDELRRDIQVLKLAQDENIQVDFLHDTCLVEPGKVLTKENKPYSVFGAWQKNWAKLINGDIKQYIESALDCKPNDKEIKKDEALLKLFESKVPNSIPGFELSNQEMKIMSENWKAGEKAAQEMLDCFINSPLKSSTSRQTTLTKKTETSDGRQTPINQYSTLRNRPDLPGTSQLSAYLAAGVISARACIRASLKTKEVLSEPMNGILVHRRDLGVGMWQSELGWRDFYQHVLAAWPRVSMGRAFNLKYEKVVWEYDEDLFQKWKEGKTGYPFIDACMRQMKEIGYMHNRGRMCVAMFLTKDLMMDWRLGEKWFMENLVDGDLGSNNGGWQWSSSTGTDAQPYFRIFAPESQSKKSDPDGDFIRRWVPELKSVSGKNIHTPYESLSKEKFKTLGYPEPIVNHAIVRKRALARFKNPGCNDNE